MKIYVTRTSLGGSSKVKPCASALPVDPPLQYDWMIRYWYVDVATLGELLALVPEEEDGSTESGVVLRHEPFGLTLEFYDDWRE